MFSCRQHLYHRRLPRRRSRLLRPEYRRGQHHYIPRRDLHNTHHSLGYVRYYDLTYPEQIHSSW